MPRASNALMLYIYDLSNTFLPALRYLATSSVSIAIPPLSILILLFHDDQGTIRPLSDLPFPQSFWVRKSLFSNRRVRDGIGLTE